MREQAAKWRGLSETDKKPYDKSHAEDVTRYEKECEAGGFDKARRHAPHPPRRLCHRPAHGRQSTPGKKREREAKEKKDAAEPKKQRGAERSAAKKAKKAVKAESSSEEEQEEEEGVVEEEEEEEEEEVGLPEGYKVAAPPPKEQLADIGEGEKLVGKKMMYNWGGVGWCVGEITERNTDEALKIGKDMCNFKVHYPVDDDTSDHNFELRQYSKRGLAGGVDKWFLLEEDEPVDVVATADSDAEEEAAAPAAAEA